MCFALLAAHANVKWSETCETFPPPKKEKKIALIGAAVSGSPWLPSANKLPQIMPCIRAWAACLHSLFVFLLLTNDQHGIVDYDSKC